MSTQTAGVKAYVFVMRRQDRFYGTVGAIANDREQAVADLRVRFAHLTSPEELEFFGIAFAVMHPALIECYKKGINDEGCYAFLEGMFFCRCEDYQVVQSCRQEKTSYGWMALAYPNIYCIKPL